MKVKTKGYFIKQKASSNNMKMLFIKCIVKSSNSATGYCGYYKCMWVQERTREVHRRKICGELLKA